MIQVANSKKSKAILLSCVGAALEYYDFIIYGMMVMYLSQVFFPENTSELGYLKTFSILAIGYFARPVGGYLFGLIADKYGRKKALLMIMLIMACATMTMGLLTFARLLQGLSFGAEIPNMTAIVRENTKPGTSGKYFGIMMSSTAIGTLLAYGILTVLTRFFSEEAIVQGMWRIPFLLGGVLALVVFVLRTRIDETPDFLELKQSARLHHSSKAITTEIFKFYWKNLINGFSLSLFFSFLILFSIYLPVYLKEYFYYEPPIIFFWMTLSILLSVCLSPWFGHIFDRLNRAKAVKVLTLCFLVFLAISLKLLATHSTWALVLFLFGYQLFISSYATNIFALLSTLFPLHIRSTGIGICYNTAHSIGSMTPLILTSLVHAQNYNIMVMVFASIVVMMTFLGGLLKQPEGLTSIN